MRIRVQPATARAFRCPPCVNDVTENSPLRTFFACLRRYHGKKRTEDVRADPFRPQLAERPRMTVAPLEEVRRRRRALGPAVREKKVPALKVSLAGSADSMIPARGGLVLPWSLAALFFCLTLAVAATWWCLSAAGGSAPGAVSAVQAASVAADRPVITRPHQQAIERALSDLRSGLAIHALSALRKVRAEDPNVPSLDYLIALAAFQAGDIGSAAEALASTLGKGERVSDALALRGAIEAQTEGGGGWTPLGNVEPAADRFLREAMAADPANPFPYFEMAMRMRSRGDHAGARGMLESARLRLQPVDAHTAIDVSLRLLELQEKADAALPQMPFEAAAPADLFGAAYLGFRLGQPEEATGFLRKAGGILPPDLFAYLVADPVFAPYQEHLGHGWANLVP